MMKILAGFILVKILSGVRGQTAPEACHKDDI